MTDDYMTAIVAQHDKRISELADLVVTLEAGFNPQHPEGQRR
jgi:hypothetical protein